MRKRSRPVLHLPRTQFEKLLEVLTALGLIILIAVTVWGYITLPAVIPTHYGFSGAPNAYGSKGSLLTLPIVCICLAVLLTVLSRYPHIYNYPWPITTENAPRQYYLARLLMCWITLEMVWMLCGLQGLIIQSAQSPHTPDAILLLIPASVLGLFVTIILYICIAARAR
ncbi:MAG TPA: DUF1648 domain-containing protein [Ktedonobacteraceae bacterium]|nr:DUF1648 domain-containing protein [Ktedonobacteraceae bacterium]